MALSLMLSFTRRLRSFRHLLIAASFALPDCKHRVRITDALIDRAVRRYDLAATSRTSTTTRGTRFDVNRQRVIVRHNENSEVERVDSESKVKSCPSVRQSKGDDLRTTRLYQVASCVSCGSWIVIAAEACSRRIQSYPAADS